VQEGSGEKKGCFDPPVSSTELGIYCNFPMEGRCIDMVQGPAFPWYRFSEGGFIAVMGSEPENHVSFVKNRVSFREKT
jgi:hypothetical protein